MTPNYTDIALIENDSGEYDVGIESQDLVMEDGFETAIIISLFTDARVDPADLPSGQTDLRGWWGDAIDPDGDQTGSLLWLLDRAAADSDTLAEAQEYAETALQWMIDDGVAQAVTVSASFSTNGVMILLISIQKPDGSTAPYEFSFAWIQQLQSVS